ncbi:GAF domain-containing protein [Mycolicibacterium komossense]|uniref:GAF domain-containing protein n=1 Tax=Mycolicibacterium komossense TaxID=1779 RepID=A0ABT3C5Q2_9MYCO|nr:GAF domain-containing protein [Mycolicibacterium komossense]MCV7224803.1 GAF domain-containing protein [Mycolicibacterium komossense]
MTAPEPHATDTTSGLAGIASTLEDIAARLNVKSVLVMRSEPDSMVVAATAGEATKHYTVGAAGKKAGADDTRIPLYCERVVDTDSELFVRDSRADATFAGNEDETDFGLHNYFGLAVHDSTGNVVGTVCVLDDRPRDYTDDQRHELRRLRSEIEAVVSQDATALGLDLGEVS